MRNFASQSFRQMQFKIRICMTTESANLMLNQKLLGVHSHAASSRCNYRLFRKSSVCRVQDKKFFDCNYAACVSVK